jgi:hypothetical protein
MHAGETLVIEALDGRTVKVNGKFVVPLTSVAVILPTTAVE